MSDCVMCKCTDIKLDEHTCQNLQSANTEKLRDFAIYYRDLQTCHLAEEGAKGFYNVWCMFKNLIAYVCHLANKFVCVQKNINALKKRDEQLCAKEQAIIKAHNAVNNQLRLLNNYNLEVYNQAMAKYKQDLLDAQRNTNKIGYLSEPLEKLLIMNNEPNATLTGTGRVVSKSVFDSLPANTGGFVNPSRVNYNSTVLDTISTKGAVQYYVMRVGDTVSALYTDLENTSYEGEKVDRILYTYRLKSIQGANQQLVVTLLNSPDTTIRIHSYGATSTTYEIEITIKFYVNGVEIVPSPQKPFPVMFNSLNSKNGVGEFVKDFKGKFIPINGSAITVRDGKAINYNAQSIEELAERQGSTQGWDGPNNMYNWMGAIGGKVTEPIKFTIGHTGGSNWFSFNTNLSAQGVVLKPIKPHNMSLTDLEGTCDDLDSLPCTVA